MADVLVVVVGIAFLLSGVMKAALPGTTARFLTDLGLPSGVARPLTRAVALWECCLSLWLFKAGNSLAAATVALTSASFVMVLLRAKLAHIDASCGCFGILDGGRLGWVQISRACALALCSLGLATMWQDVHGNYGVTFVLLVGIGVVGIILVGSLIEATFELRTRAPGGSLRGTHRRGFSVDRRAAGI